MPHPKKEHVTPLLAMKKHTLLQQAVTAYHEKKHYVMVHSSNHVYTKNP
jgi:hypothetical protein